MTIDLAMEHIARRMEELGHGSNYYTRFRHLVLSPGERREILAYNELYVLLEEAADIAVHSDTGVFDLSLAAVNELQYEHEGLIQVTGHGTGIHHVRFIQAIPFYCGRINPCCDCQCKGEKK